MLHSPCCPLCLNTAGTYSPRLWTGSCSCFLFSPFAPAGCHRWGERSAGGETGCWSCSGNPWSLFWSRPKNEQSPLCTSWIKKQTNKPFNMYNLNIFSCAHRADRDTDSTWCRWWAAPSAWCSPCAGWCQPVGMCLDLWGRCLAPGSGTELSGWSLPQWDLSKLSAGRWGSAMFSFHLESSGKNSFITGKLNYK